MLQALKKKKSKNKRLVYEKNTNPSLNPIQKLLKMTLGFIQHNTQITITQDETALNCSRLGFKGMNLCLMFSNLMKPFKKDLDL